MAGPFLLPPLMITLIMTMGSQYKAAYTTPYTTAVTMIFFLPDALNAAPVKPPAATEKRMAVPERRMGILH